MHLAHYSSLAAVLALAGCASQPPGTRPDDMSAFQHHRVAAMHSQRAAQLETQYDPSARQTKTLGSHSADFDDNARTYNPTEKFLTQAEEERAVAAKHNAAATVLEEGVRNQCGPLPADERSSCPLVGSVQAEQDIPGGARLLLQPGVAATDFAEHVRCHHAFGRAAAFQGMPACPLYLKNIEINVAPDGHSVTITSDDEATVREIRERARAHGG